MLFTDPRSLPWTFVGLELVFAACFALTVRDVIARWKSGERYALFQWLVILTYGVAMELVAFNAYPDYEHGRFTVQLYGGKLPLYVTFVYVVFHYTGLKLAERRGHGPVVEAVVAGLAIALLDVPFDVVGVRAAWWTWHPSSHDVAQRWLGVPLTSYAWYLIFGAILVGACRLLRPRIEKRGVGAYVLLAPLVAVGIIVAGIVAFLPFHALEAIGVPDGAIVAVHAAVALGLALRAPVRAPSGAAGPVPAWLGVVPGLLAAWHLAVLGALWRGGAADATTSLVAIVAAPAILALVFVRGRARAPQPVTDRSASPPRPPLPAGSRTSS